MKNVIDKDTLLHEIDTLPNDMVTEVYNYVSYIKIRESLTPMHKLPNVETCEPDEFDKELIASIDRNEESVPFEEVLKECGVTLHDLQNRD